MLSWAASLSRKTQTCFFRAKKIQEHGEAGTVAGARRNRTRANDLPQPPLLLREHLKTMQWERQDIRIPEGYGSASIFFAQQNEESKANEFHQPQFEL
jgi:hypothetical protein